MDAVELVAAVTTPPSSTELREVPRNISWLQIRSDLIGDVPADWLRAHFPGRLLFTLRTSSSGGRFDRSNLERKRRLIAAAHEYDLVELEAGGDLQADLLDAVPPSKRILVWRGPASEAGRLHSHFLELSNVAARYYCMVLAGVRPSDGLQPLSLMKTLGRGDVIAFCDGLWGAWSRLLSPTLGAPLLFGQLEEPAQSAGDFSVRQLMADYGFPTVRPLKKLYGMVGNRIFQSPSPRLHNTAYKLLDQPALFLPFHAEKFEEFWNEMVLSRALDDLSIPIQGLVIVSPFKEAAPSIANSCSDMVARAGSSNVFAHHDGAWTAETTDPESIAAIRNFCPAKAAVIGCGGAGRAIAAALQQTGSDVTLVNRGLRRAAYATQLLKLPFVPLSEFRAHGYDVIVNATPVGRDNDGFPFVIDTLSDRTLVIDLAYGSQPTPLVSAVLSRGGTAIDGHDVLLSQVRKQFYLMTGSEMPPEVDRDMVIARGPRDFALQSAFGISNAIAGACEYST